MNTQNTLSKDMGGIAEKHGIDPDIFMEVVCDVLASVYAEEALFQAELQLKTLVELGNMFNDYSAQVKAMGAIDLTNPPEEWEDLQRKMECVLSVIKEKAYEQVYEETGIKL